MSNVLTFAPRPKPVAPEAPEPLSGAELRVQIEAGVQAALDLADHYIAVLNGLGGCPDLEDSGDAEPSLAAPENHTGPQVTWLRGNDADREAEAPETALPEVQASPMPKLRPTARAPAEQPRQSSFVAAAAVALIDFAGVRS